LIDQNGSGKALQSILERFHRERPEVELKRTASGAQWSTAEEDRRAGRRRRLLR
jgi:hypothetical protein